MVFEQQAIYLFIFNTLTERDRETKDLYVLLIYVKASFSQTPTERNGTYLRFQHVKSNVNAQRNYITVWQALSNCFPYSLKERTSRGCSANQG